MASGGIRVCLILAVVGMLYSGALAQSSCNNVLTNLASCLNYVTGNSSTPSSTCCSQLANVVQSSPQCLCTLLNNNGPSIGITINQTLALSLPGACKVQTQPINQCKAATAPTTSAAPPTVSAATPVSSPASSPTASSNETPDAAVTPSASEVPTSSRSGTGSKTVPTTTNGTSDGSITKAPLHFMLFAYFVLWCGLVVTKF